MKPRSLFALALSLSSLVSPLSAATWTWQWKPAPGDNKAQAEITTFQYGKDWAYAIELDDGPKWAREFAVPFFGKHQWTDAPPGVAGGNKKPFVGGVAVIVSPVGANAASNSWEDLNSLLQSGWGVLNHSWAHSGFGWAPDGRLSDEKVKEDAWWSQALMAHHLSTGRGPTGAVFANGYTDYNRDGALEKVGIVIATRVAGSSPKDVTDPKVNLMDFDRNYLDDGAWLHNGFEGKPVAGIPDAEGNGPTPNSFIIDFTHDIAREPDSPNQKRWDERLTTIAQRWGAGGKDNVWVAPTDAVGNYVRATRDATVKLDNGKLTVSIPDNLPGTPLTLKLTGVQAKDLTAPEGGVLYRQGDTVWLTTPMIGVPGSPQPKLKLAYDGPPGDITFEKPVKAAGVIMNIFGDVPAGFTYKSAWHTAKGDQPIPIITYKGGWVVGGKLYPIVPTNPAIEATGISVEPNQYVTKVKVWALDEP